MSRNFFSTGFLLKNSFYYELEISNHASRIFHSRSSAPTLEFKSFPLETTKSIIQHLKRDYSFVF